MDLAETVDLDFGLFWVHVINQRVEIGIKSCNFRGNLNLYFFLIFS